MDNFNHLLKFVIHLAVEIEFPNIITISNYKVDPF